MLCKAIDENEFDHIQSGRGGEFILIYERVQYIKGE